MSQICKETKGASQGNRRDWSGWPLKRNFGSPRVALSLQPAFHARSMALKQMTRGLMAIISALSARLRYNNTRVFNTQLPVLL